MRILGLSYGFHDAAAALLVDGEVVGAVEEERISRTKHDPDFPERAADTCLAIAGIDARDIDAVAFHEKPLAVVQRHLTARLRSGPAGLRALLTRTPATIGEQLTVGHRVERWFEDRSTRLPPLHYFEHHQSHAAAAYFASPFDEAAVLTIDGVGEWATATTGWGRGNRLTIDQELRYPDSVGLLYSAFTAYCGFRVNGGEGELMGLAPFGSPTFLPALRDQVVELRPDGSVALDLDHFSFLHGTKTFSQRLEVLLGEPARQRDEPLRRHHADVAASAQALLEEIVMAMAHAVHRETGRSKLCLGGGVALNCAANGRLRREGPFEDVWVQPACGDAGSAIGAALALWHDELERPRPRPAGDAMSGAFLGPAFGQDEVASWLQARGVAFEVLDADERDRVVAQLLADGAVVGWFTGRMEFGPRALGHRSILADPRSSDVQHRINAMVKERALFRPFAPAVLAERASEWFAAPGSPYMTFVVPVAEARLAVPDRIDGDDPDDLEAIVAQVRSEIPAVTHVDGSARVQIVEAATNPELAGLLRAFEEQTGCPVLLNTSFNHRDEPIVCTPADALATFERISLDVLVLERCIVRRADRRGSSPVIEGDEPGPATRGLDSSPRPTGPPSA